MIHMGITTKEIVNRGFFNGPIVPIYGVGVLLILTLLDGIKSNLFLTTIFITVICTILEYFTSYFMEKIYKIRWWDYTGKKFNLHGRVCFETMFMFVIMALGVVYYIHPVFSNVLNTLSNDTIHVLGIILLIVFIFDYLFSNYVLKHFLNSDITVRKDKTPAIREFTKNMLKNKILKK